MDLVVRGGSRWMINLHCWSKLPNPNLGDDGRTDVTSHLVARDTMA